MTRISSQSLIGGVIVLLVTSCFFTEAQTAQVIFADDFSNGLKHWVMESESNQSVFSTSNKELDIISPKGLTVWLNKKLEGNLQISYEAYVVDENGLYDRVSDLNCFWIANDSLHPDNFFSRSNWRAGKFVNYYSLQLYYAGYGGNDNTTTRFRKYDGDYERYIRKKIQPPILKEYNDKSHMIKPNTWCLIKILVKDGWTAYKFNEEILFEFTDGKPNKQGYFGFRTVQNHVKIRNFKITRLP